MRASILGAGLLLGLAGIALTTPVALADGVVADGVVAEASAPETGDRTPGLSLPWLAVGLGVGMVAGAGAIAVRETWR